MAFSGMKAYERKANSWENRPCPSHPGAELHRNGTGQHICFQMEEESKTRPSRKLCWRRQGSLEHLPTVFSTKGNVGHHSSLPSSVALGPHFYIWDLGPSVAVKGIYQDIRSCLSFLCHSFFFKHCISEMTNLILPLSRRFMVLWNYEIEYESVLWCNDRIHTKYYFTQKCWGSVFNLKVNICP